MDSKDRVTLDCRNKPEAQGCSLTMSGTEEEVLDIAEYHATTKHDFKKEPGLRDKLRSFLKHEAMSR
jgi:hypothetical protein